MTIKEAIASLKIDAENVAFDADEDGMSPQAKRFIEAVKTVSDALQSRCDWTPCAEGLPEDAKPEDLFRVFIQRTVKSGNVIREFTKEASFRYGMWINVNGFVIGNSKYDPYKETVVAYHRVPAFYNPDRKEDAE